MGDIAADTLPLLFIDAVISPRRPTISLEKIAYDYCNLATWITKWKCFIYKDLKRNKIS